MKADRGQRRFREAVVVPRRQAPGTDGEAGCDHDQQGWEDAPDAPLVEGQEREGAGVEFARDDRGDQVAGNDEEYVDTDEPAGEEAELGMKKDDGSNGDGAQPIDIRPIRDCRHRPLSPGAPQASVMIALSSAAACGASVTTLHAFGRALRAMTANAHTTQGHAPGVQRNSPPWARLAAAPIPWSHAAQGVSIRAAAPSNADCGACGRRTPLRRRIVQREAARQSRRCGPAKRRVAAGSLPVLASRRSRCTSRAHMLYLASRRGQPC